jgi:protease I
MATTLNGRRVAILAADGVERVELERPRQALEDAGARTEVVSITSGEIQARDHDLEDAGTFAVEKLVGAVSVDDYEALLLPGGTVPSVRTDLRNAGAEVVDEEVVTDGNITTSRSPDDLPAFCERIVQAFACAPQSAGAGGRA